MSARSRRVGRRLVALVLTAGVAVAVISAISGDDGGHTVSAVFSDAQGLRNGDPVRVAGVDVGQVTAVDLASSGRSAVVRLRIDDARIQVHRDARAALRWRTLLGGAFYVDLSPGSPAAGRATAPLPVSRTSAQVTFDDVLQPFAEDTRSATRSTLREMRRGLSDPVAVRRAIAALPETVPTLRKGIRGLRGERSDDLSALVRGTSRTVAGLGDDEARLRQLIVGADATLGVTARTRHALGRMVALSPSTLDATKLTTRRLRRTLVILDPLAARLRPAARRLGPALTRTKPVLVSAARLLRNARPLLVDLAPAMRSLRTVGEEGAPLVGELRPTVERLDTQILPWLAKRDPETGRSTYEMLGPTTAAAGGIGAQLGSVGHVIRFALSGGESALLSSPCQTSFADPTTTQKVRCDELSKALQQILSPPPK